MLQRARYVRSALKVLHWRQPTTLSFLAIATSQTAKEKFSNKTIEYYLLLIKVVYNLLRAKRRGRTRLAAASTSE